MVNASGLLNVSDSRVALCKMFGRPPVGLPKFRTVCLQGLGAVILDLLYRLRRKWFLPKPLSMPLVLKRRLPGFYDLMLLVSFRELIAVISNETADCCDLVQRPPTRHSAIRETVA